MKKINIKLKSINKEKLMSDYEMAKIHEEKLQLKRNPDVVDLETAIKNTEVIQILTQACIKLDDKKAIEGILNIIKNLSTDNISNLIHA